MVEWSQSEAVVGYTATVCGRSPELSFGEGFIVRFTRCTVAVDTPVAAATARIE